MVFIAPGNPQPPNGHFSPNHNTGIIEPLSAEVGLNYSKATIYILLLLTNISGLNYYKAGHKYKYRLVWSAKFYNIADRKRKFEAAMAPNRKMTGAGLMYW